jgi:hypothetical protein
MPVLLNQAGDKGLPLPGRQDLENRIYIDRSPQSQGGKSQRERAQRYYRTFTGFSEFSTGDKAFHNVLPLGRLLEWTSKSSEHSGWWRDFGW